MSRSLFNRFEKRQTEPVYLKWKITTTPISLSADEYLCSGDLITIDPLNDIQKNAFYVLTTTLIIESDDSFFKNPVNALSFVRFRNPTLHTTNRPDLKL